MDQLWPIKRNCKSGLVSTKSRNKFGLLRFTEVPAHTILFSLVLALGNLEVSKAANITICLEEVARAIFFPSHVECTKIVSANLSAFLSRLVKSPSLWVNQSPIDCFVLLSGNFE
jgi:hypothetical protein